ncbi:monocyte chemotactic protein 1B-like [Scleropages formosus]|uniref:monocyte chemotactic protein 1B-like n=1 Tax=Scleropages formosus TaxID=113540 RepID=UPI0008782D9C|nr:monocyte chemotactic protein 1B-like [Scleropages formosus]
MKTLSLVLLSLSIVLLCVASGQASSPVASCCLKTTNTKVQLNLLLKYHEQHSVCSVKAVQFVTIRGKTICADPSDSWAQRAISHLERKSNPTTSKPNPAKTTIKHLSPGN